MSNNNYLFTCKSCGSHELKVVHEYTSTEFYEATLDCECEDKEDDIAAHRSYHVTTPYREWSWLHEVMKKEEYEIKEPSLPETKPEKKGGK